MKNIKGFIIGLLVFIALIGTAFNESILFGIIFVLGGLYALYTGEFVKNPALPVGLFAGGLITRIATTEHFLPIFKSETLFDLVIEIFIFAFIYLVGHGMKKGNLK